jgi:hypothetical protein
MKLTKLVAAPVWRAEMTPRACGALIPSGVRVVGVLGGVASADAPGYLSSISGPLRLVFRLGRSAPAVLRILFRLYLGAVRQGGPRAGERMAPWAALSPPRSFS